MEKAIKSLGQNFIKDLDLVKKMVSLLDIQNGDDILEIGPGPGAFTKEIALRLNDTNKFTAVELDPRFYVTLSETFKDKSNITIIKENFLDWIKNVVLHTETVVLGAIPYYITSPIIHSLIKSNVSPKCIVLMIQKEVAEKICEKNNKPNYFSNFVKTFYNAEYIETVSRNKFYPVPKVDSAVIRITKLKEVSVKDIVSYEEFLHKGFSKQKKMLNKIFSSDLLSSISITSTDRPHNLKVEDWINLYNKVKSK